ncbi:PREDICTED: protein wntless-like [Nicrophorus vespilloides]|uniref:Protein wntless n=1 Tax=Nicrophorus vespilloides TaxID=110193 RepID=A0ABM1MHQ7_NICVS|nr:PREDICTED: protein wntless-like [Nicrophorus vespilloides]
MPGTILENLSGRKLSVLVAVFLIGQVICFLIGGLTAPAPASTMTILSTACIDPHPENTDPSRWIARDCKQKVELSHRDKIIDKHITAKDIVFVGAMPLGMPRLDFSRWQQNLVGVIQIDLLYEKELKLEPSIELTLNARLFYKNKGDTEWKYYSHAEEKRLMDCSFDYVEDANSEGYPYNCTTVPLFELGSLHHDYYMLNLRLPADKKRNNIGWISDIHLHVIHMNGGFTRVWLSMKAVFFPIILAIMTWFWNRVHILQRTPALLEYMLISLGGTLAFLDLPLEFLTLFFEMPYMLLLGDIRQGIFYAMLLSFWLVFAGEHMLINDQGEKNSLRLYWKHLSAIVIGCTSLLIFDLCERGVQLRNPFYSIWVTPVGTNLALSFIILAGISAGIYFIFLCYMIWNVFRNISIKRAVLPNMSSARRLHYEGIIYRFNFLMLATLICAAITIVSFILSQINEGQHKWDDSMDIELSSALFTGVYGMWNIYICAMLILYAPSHKQWPSDPICGENGEEVEFNRLPTDSSPNEISSLTSFASKAAIE